jgi:glycosyltransferase involved in cell wall biosynthesis
MYTDFLSKGHKMRILCIAPSFVPAADSEAFCAAKMVMELSNREVEVITICLDPYRPIKRAIDDSYLWKGLEDRTIEISSDAGGSKLKSIFNGIEFHSFTYARWLRAVLDKSIQLDRDRPFDVVYSRSLPMIGHVAGYWVSRKLKRPWIANINDPWDWHLFPNKNSVKMSLGDRLDSNYWFRKTLRSASIVTYPTERLRDYHIRLSGIDHKSLIVPHIGYGILCDRAGKEFTLTHTGKLGGNEHTGRSIRGLLMGLKGMLAEHEEARTDVKLVLVGARDISTERMMREMGMDSLRIETTGRVNYEESLRYIGLASVCILIEGKLSEGIFLPSKLVDYLAANKPILALSPKTGTIADFGSGRGIIRVDLDNAEQIKLALCEVYGSFKQGSLGRLSSNLADRFSPTVVVDRFLECAKGVLTERKQAM